MSNDKMRSEFETAYRLIFRFPNLTIGIDGKYLSENAYISWEIWQAALSQSEPEQVSQTNLSNESIKYLKSENETLKEDVEILKKSCALKSQAIKEFKEEDHALRMFIDEQKAEINKLKASPPDYEALKLRVAELEDSNINQHYMSRISILHNANDNLEADKSRLQSECDSLKEELNAWKIGYGSKAK